MKVFISSLEAGYEQFRAAAAEAVETLGHQVVRAEGLPASTRTPQQGCLAAVRESDLVLLLVGERYGDRQASGMSATHEEYLEARERKPVLLFVEDCVTREEAQLEFLREIDGWVTGHFRAIYTTPEELKTAVLRGLHDYELATASGPVDEAEILARAQASVPDDRRGGAGSSQLILVVAGGPHRQVLRPVELEDDGLRRDIQSEAMFGQHAVLDDEAATRRTVHGGVLALEQPAGSVALDQMGTIRIIQAARHDSDRQRLALPSLIEEDLIGALSHAIQFSAWILDRIDPLGRLTDLVPLACLAGGGYLPWRTRAEQAASPTSATMGIGTDLVTACLTPARRHRRALTHDTGRITEDLIALLRRQLRR